MTDIAFTVHLLVAMLAGFAALNAVLNLHKEFLSAIMLGAFAVVYGIAPLFLEQGERPVTSALACFAAICGIMAGKASAAKFWGAPTGLPLREMFHGGSRRYILVTQAIGLFGILVYAYGLAGSLGAYLASGRFEYRLDPSNANLVLIGIYLTPFMITPALIMAISKSRFVRVTGIIYGTATALSLFFYLKGTRSLAIGLIVGMIVLVALNRRPDSHKNVSRQRHLVAVAAAAIIAMVVLPNMYQARHLLSSEEVSAQDVLVGPSESASDDEGGVFAQEPLNYSEFLQAAVVIFPANHDYLWVYPIRRIAFFPLKSSVDGLKPPDTNVAFAEAVGRGSNAKTTIPPSLPGEGYVVFGGVLGSGIWALLYGLGVGWLEAKMRKPYVALTVLSTGFPSALLALRGQFYELFLSLTLTLILCAVITRIVKPRADETGPPSTPPQIVHSAGS